MFIMIAMSAAIASCGESDLDERLSRPRGDEPALEDIEVPELVVVVTDGEPASGSTAASVPRAPKPPVTDPSATSVPATAPTADIIGPYESGGLAAIIAQFELELGYSPRVLEVLLSADFAQFQIQDPAAPENVDSYQWRDGAFGEPKPVSNGLLPADLDAASFALTEINADAAVMLHGSGQALDIDGAEVSTTVIKRFLPFSSDIRWFVNVSGARESKQIRADANGVILEVV